MSLAAGDIIEGRVSGITSYGAFVALPDGKSGLVHISEISYSFVNNVHDILAEGQTVKVKVLSIDDSGRINLSIKKAAEPPPRQQPRQQQKPQARQNSAPAAGSWQSAPQKQDISFEDRLKQFMQESDSKLSSSALYKKNTSTRRGGRR